MINLAEYRRFVVCENRKNKRISGRCGGLKLSAQLKFISVEAGFRHRERRERSSASLRAVSGWIFHFVQNDKEDGLKEFHFRQVLHVDDAHRTIFGVDHHEVIDFETVKHAQSFHRKRVHLDDFR